MDKMTQGLFAQMYRELQEVEILPADPLKKAQLSFEIVEKHIITLKDFITSRTFKNQDEEIRFFKEIKPQFLKELIYFSELCLIEELKPNGSFSKQRRYYKQWLRSIKLFFDRNRSFYNYYRTGQVNSDERFFVRAPAAATVHYTYRLDLDPAFSTPYSIKLGKLQAYEQLRSYLLQAIAVKSNKDSIEVEKAVSNTTWTDSKAALIELLYAVHARGSVNFGKMPIKQLVAAAEAFFNIRLGNVYTTLLSMGIRKKDRTPYLRSLIVSLENRLDEKDE